MQIPLTPPSAKPKNAPKALLAMSGGVDSSVAAVLLQQQGYHVVGCFMRHRTDQPQSTDCKTTPNTTEKNTKNTSGDISRGISGGNSGGNNNSPLATQARSPAGGTGDGGGTSGGGHKQGCCSVDDASDARMVAAILDIPLYVLNFDRQFDRIIDYFVDEYNAGRTPNPCVRCNDWLKFGKLFEYADTIGAHYVATGHYARIQNIDGKKYLTRGRDLHKDQSYVLFGTPRHRLDRMLLPIGEFLNKSEIRKIAQQHNLPVFNKPDSQEICFVPDQDYAKLIDKRSTPENRPTPGRIVDTAGHDLGQHDGHQHYTIGQRRGLSLSLGHPIYVVHKNPHTNTVTVGLENDLLTTALTANQINWLDPTPPTHTPPHPHNHMPDHPDTTNPWQPCSVKIRSTMTPVPAQYRRTPDDQLHITFDTPTRAVSPGQAVVCYHPKHPDRVLGGGWIHTTTTHTPPPPTPHTPHP